MKTNKLINKAVMLSGVLLIVSQLTACGTQSMMSGLALGDTQSLSILDQSAQTDGDFSVLAAAKKPAAKPAPKKQPPPPPKPLPKAFMDALKKHPELLPGFNALKGLAPHEHFPKLQALVKDYPDLVKLLPKPPAGAPPVAPSGAPSGAPPAPPSGAPEGMQPPPPGDMPPPPEGAPSCSPPPAEAPPAPESSPEAPPTPPVNDQAAEGTY